MLTHVLTYDQAPLGQLSRPQPENLRDHGADSAFNLRCMGACGFELAAMTRVPKLDWPSDLFADARAEFAA